MNTDLETNFNKALNLCETNFSHTEIINLLKSLDSINCQEDADIFINNLTGCDGKIREAIASRLEEFITITPDLFPKHYRAFADATIDINANIARFVIDALQIFKNNVDFGTNYSTILMNFIDEAFKEIEQIKFRDKKYVLNKQLFKIYWALEGLNTFYLYTKKETLFTTLSKVLDRHEYTIREKAAEIIIKLHDDNNFSELLRKIENDENFYVKRIINKLKEN